jgi:chromosome partitioning protein
MDYFALEGAGLTLKVIKESGRITNREVEVLGFLPTFFDARTKISKTILDELTGKYQEKVFETPIRVNTQIKEAQMNHKTIFEYAPYSHGAYDYYRFVKEALDRLSKVKVYE